MKQRMHLSLRMLAIIVAVVAAFGVMGVVFAYDPFGFVIDSFQESLELVAKGSTPPAIYTYTTVTAGTGIVGGELDVEIDNTANDGGALRQVRVTSSSGKFSYSSDDTVKGLARLTWDGPDGNATTLNPTGLGGVDITNGGLNTGFAVRLSSDHVATVTLSVYTNGSNWASGSFAVPNTFNATQTFFVPFSSLTSQAGTLNTSSVGAIVLFIDGTDTDSAGLDLTLDFVEANRTDLGDDPDTYSTLVTSTGARHVLGGNFLGASVDAELDGQPNAGATGDDNNGVPNDEDGVVRYKNWATNRAYVRVLYTQTVTGCLNGWLDWTTTDGTGGPDGLFDGPGERIIGTDAQPGGVVISLTKDFTSSLVSLDFTTNPSYYARFRVTPDEDNDGDCRTTDVHAPQQAVGPTGTAYGGEVEDYRWDFGPNAVTLESLQAKPVTTSPVLPLALVGGAAAILLGAVLFTRKSRKQSV